MKTNLKDLIKDYNSWQSRYMMGTPPLPWKERDKAWNDLMEEIERVEEALDKIDQ
jgi:hypothetical protein